jgi:hypothetical protein
MSGSIEKLRRHLIHHNIDFFINTHYVQRTQEIIPMTKKLTTKTKVDTVIALCERKGGCSLKDIMDKLGVSKVAAGSLIADARRAKGIKVKYDVESGRYYAQ